MTEKEVTNDPDRKVVLEGNKILKEQLEFYKKKGIKVHIVKHNGQYYNGTILEISTDSLILDEDVLGGMPIHFIEINILEKAKK